MKTILTQSPDEAGEFIRSGRLVAFPTETVYGLGADVFNETAIAKIFEAKMRPADNPLIAHVALVEQIDRLATEVTEAAKEFIEKFFPGPLTLVLQKADAVPEVATAGLNSIGVRMPRNRLAREFLSVCDTPVVAPSANLSGRPSPTTWRAVLEDLDGRIDCILQGDATEIGLESTVVDCTTDSPLLLRQGAVSLDELRAVVPSTIVAGDLTEAPRSPGLRHRHYSPRARVMIVDAAADVSNFIYSGDRFGYIGFRTVDGRFSAIKICSSIDDYARSLFEFFRECDRQNIDEIFCEAVDETGIGAAVMDRLRRASEAGN